MRAALAQSSLLTAALLLCSGAVAAPTQHATVTGIRVWAGPDQTRVVLDLSAPSKHSVFTLNDPDRLVVDLAGTDIAASQMPEGSGLVRAVRTGVRSQGARVVLDLTGPVRPRSFLVAPNDVYGHRLVLDLEAPTSALPKTDDGEIDTGKLAAASPTAAPAVAPTTRAPATLPKGDRDVIVAIDAGHGGEDPGARGRKGTREKDVTLAIARKLKDRIDSQPGMRAYLVRDGDYFVELGKRTRIAREKHKADLFISIHADAFKNPKAKGSSVFVLSTRGASSTAARWLADRENAADLVGGVSLSDKDDVVASVLLDLSQQGALNASMDVAGNVLKELDGLGNLHKSEVQSAGFVVLKSPDIPSILVETAFITNPEEERKLRDPKHQGRVADAILRGVKVYFDHNAPEGTRLASR